MNANFRNVLILMALGTIASVLGNLIAHWRTIRFIDELSERSGRGGVETRPYVGFVRIGPDISGSENILIGPAPKALPEAKP